MQTSQQVREYWEERAKNDKEATSTTNDIYLRQIERRVLLDNCKIAENPLILDIGCGDARTSAFIASSLHTAKISGLDYAQHMIDNANVLYSGISNLDLYVADCTSGEPTPDHLSKFDIVYSTRCLINILEDENRRNAFHFIHKSLKAGGIYLMIENFMEGQINFNRVREDYGLQPIPVRHHNRFFDAHELEMTIDGLFRLQESVNISSSYYLTSRIVYSKICEDKTEQPDYNDSHHKYASMLPFAGDFGPLYLKILRKI
jgi:SAM-dependent methyltransferase